VPDSADAHAGLSDAILQNGGNPDDAIAEARKVVSLAPDDFGNQLALALALYAKGDSKWVEPYREALRLNADSAEAHYWFGRTLAEKGDHNAAVAEYRQALDISPNYALGHFDLGGA
jgi:tetratricopeptide (TPR) repeat protein